MHEKHLIHRDIKPDNFLTARLATPAVDTIYLVDFGMAKKYRDPNTNDHIPYSENNPLSGTARYMSINAHLGREQSRRDDLEALGYVLLYFAFGRLPWQGINAAANEKTHQIGKRKLAIPFGELCKGLPNGFTKYFQYVRDLGFEDTPDYIYLQDLFSRAPEGVDEHSDGEFSQMKTRKDLSEELDIRPAPHQAALAPVLFMSKSTQPLVAATTKKRPRIDSVPTHPRTNPLPSDQ